MKDAQYTGICCTWDNISCTWGYVIELGGLDKIRVVEWYTTRAGGPAWNDEIFRRESLVMLKCWLSWNICLCQKVSVGVAAVPRDGNKWHHCRKNKRDVYLCANQRDMEAEHGLKWSCRHGQWKGPFETEHKMFYQQMYTCMYNVPLYIHPTNTHTEWVSVQEMFISCCWRFLHTYSLKHF